MGGARGRRARAHLHAAGRGDDEGRGDAALRRRRRADGARDRGGSRAAAAYVAETGATFVHPFEDPAIIAGQGTIGLELADQLHEVDTVLIPIGGGGLASGISLALRAVKPRVRIVGVQAAGTLPDGPGFTIADGIAVKKPGDLTMSILDRVLDDIVSVTDEQISEAIVLLLERTKLVVEGAGAVGVAALLSGKVPGNGTTVPLISGGNIDATLLISVMRHGLSVAGRFLVLRTRVGDRPGELAKLLTLLANERVNVVEVEHQRETGNLPVGETGVELTLVTRDPAHCDEILDAAGAVGLCRGTTRLAARRAALVARVEFVLLSYLTWAVPRSARAVVRFAHPRPREFASA